MAVASLVLASCARAPTSAPVGDAAPSAANRAAETTPASLSPGPPSPPEAGTSAHAPSAALLPRPTSWPVRLSAGGTRAPIVMAPGPAGTLYVAIGHPRGAVIARLGTDGRPSSGWPVMLPSSTACGFLAAAGDGSVRAICDAVDASTTEGAPAARRAYAFGADGSLLPGWPVDGPFRDTARIEGDRVVALASSADTSDPASLGRPHDVWIVEIGRDGALRAGEHVTMAPAAAEDWSIGPGGVAFGSQLTADFRDPGGVTDPGLLAALDQGGLRPGWPVSLAGVPSAAASLPDGRTAITIGFLDREVSRVLALDASAAVEDGSPELALATLSQAGCATTGVPPAIPSAPLAAPDGTVFAMSASGDRILALDGDLAPLPGWPYVPSPALLATDAGRRPPAAGCHARADPIRPAVGPDAALYLSLEPASASIGGGLTAIGRHGQALDGWPIQLRRSGAGFRSIVAAPDGGVFVLATEPEAGEDDSATILAVDQAGTVHERATVMEP